MMNRDILADSGYEDCIVFENPDYDEAIIGVTTDNNVVYDYYKMVQHLMGQGMSEIDAVEFIDYNTIRALPYVENAPVIVYGIDSLY